jgi:subtilisin family serine protease
MEEVTPVKRTNFGPSALPTWAALTALAALSTSAYPAGPVLGNGKAKGQAGNSAYVVQLADMPVSAYQGGIKGLQATKPKKGQKIDPNSPAVVSYMAYLATQQDKAMAGVGASKKLYSYGYVFNGFAAELTAAQAQKLAQMPGVLAVTKDEARKLDTSSTPDFLGLSGPGGVWDQTGAKGEDVIIGIVDGGVWPEHPSFSDRTDVNGNATKDGKLGYQQIPGWNGKCTPGEAFVGSNCNQKLIGARYYNAGWGGNAGIDAQLPWEYNSPRDFGGHGTHTATTAGGNAGVPATGPAAVFGSISGIAPRARIASYKVCWETGAGGSCFTTDSVAAIDQAVADGVDVINFSISGSQTSFRDPVEIAFLFAADAGVFVAASAGNSGPTTSTVAHPGPWLTTVAAGTHNRNGEGSATLGNGVSYAGASVATPVTAPLIDSTAAGLPGADPTQVALCFGAEDGGAVLDRAKVAGKIVVCQRGVTARVNKSLAVQQAGGVGMILFNSPDNSLNADFHFVPTVHVSEASGTAIKAYAATAGATASIAQATIVYNVPAPFTASFSSRGPLRAGDGDVLKPDLIAPGQDILAGVAPPGNSGRLFDLYSGTSMSSPHVAGLAALFKQKYPNWSPMAIKSALMTSAGDVLDGPNTDPLVIFRQGAGHVRPALALNPGLVYDSGYRDWLNFICGTQPGSFCSAFTPIDPSNLNLASIAIGDMAGTQTVTRKVTNVSGGPLKVDASISGLTGITAVVSPATLTLNPGQAASFTVSFTNTAAAPGSYAGGQLTWVGSGVSVRSPIVVRPVALAAPTQVSGSYNVTFGYNGPFSATPRGLIPAAVTPGTVSDDPTDGACSLTAPNAQLIPVAVPAGTTYARFALFDADVSAGADIDLCVFSGTTLVGSSGTGTSAEEVNLTNPAAGSYTVVVQGWGVVGSSPFKLHTWLLGSTAAGNMTVTAPGTAVVSQTGAITITTSGLTSATKYLGSVAYDGTSGMPSPTIVRIDTP